jgi:hypothetical protein
MTTSATQYSDFNQNLIDHFRDLYDAQAKVMPGFAEYQRKTTRRIPVVVLERLIES